MDITGVQQLLLHDTQQTLQVDIVPPQLVVHWEEAQVGPPVRSDPFLVFQDAGPRHVCLESVEQQGGDVDVLLGVTDEVSAGADESDWGGLHGVVVPGVNHH